MCGVSFWEYEKYPKTVCGDFFFTTGNILKAIELYILNGWIVCELYKREYI